MTDTNPWYVISSLSFGLFFGALIGQSLEAANTAKVMQQMATDRITVRETQTLVPFCTMDEITKQAKQYCGDIIGDLMPPTITKEGKK